MASFFVGFFYVFAAPVNVTFTIDGVSTSTLTAGETVTFAIQLTNTDEVTMDGDFSILDESGIEISGFSNISCGNGEDVSALAIDPIVFCFWDPVISTSDEVSFDITIDTAGTYTLLVFTYTDDLDDFEGIEKEFSLTVEAAAVENPFTFSTGTTRDLDSDGYIDTVKLTFSVDPDHSTVDISDITVDGYTVVGVSQWTNLLEFDSDSIRVDLAEGSNLDGGETPSVTISGFTDGDGNAIEATTATLVDNAPPVMVSALIAEDGESIEVTFSEDINGTTVNSTGTDFTLSENSITTADETSPGVVTLTLGATTSSTSMDVTVGTTDIDDLAGNTTSEHTVTATPAPDTTPITIQGVGLTTSAASTDSVSEGDTITLTFTLSELANTSTIGILDESNVSVATTSTTYTAIYTVDADTAAGAATFSISIKDAAENETVATSTTDGSALNIVVEEEGGGSGGGSSIAFSIALSASDGGLNLISLPVSPSNTSIGTVLGSIIGSVESVWTMIDSQWYVYYPDNANLSNLETMNAGYAYYIEVSSDATLSGSGTLSAITRTLSSGWHMVGYLQSGTDATGTVSIDTAFSSVGLAGVAYSELVEYEGGAQVASTDVDLGEGFFMNVAGSSVILQRTI